MVAVTVFRFVISDPKTGRSFQREIEKKKATAIIGTKVGDEFDGGILGLPAYRLQITGGSDEAGMPILRGVTGPGRKRVLLMKPPCVQPERLKTGMRKRKTVRGTAIAEDLMQINTKVVKYGKQSLEEIFGVAKPAEEEKVEEKKEGAQAEKKKEEATAKEEKPTEKEKPKEAKDEKPVEKEKKKEKKPAEETPTTTQKIEPSEEDRVMEL